jgi:flavodoxin
MKSLVVYYSRDGNTKFLAQTIASKINADTEELEDLKNRKGFLNWFRAGSDARKGATTEIKPIIKVPKDYDLIIFGSPIWASRHVPAITTYVKQNEISGKKVAVFFAMGGKKPQPASRLRVLMPNSEFIGEISVTQPLKNKEAAEEKIVAWCETLKA